MSRKSGQDCQLFSESLSGFRPEQPILRVTMHRPEMVTAKGQRRREALLRAAVEVIAEKGYAGVTHRAVAERAGVPMATTSYFFSSIHELVQEAAAQYHSQQLEDYLNVIE